MSEGSLEAPIRHPIPWEDPDFYDAEKLDAELRRVFDICHGCRRCFNLCDSFPRLFDLIDDSESGELDTVDSADFKPVVDACTLCDMCFMTKCPYVPPHEFDLDFPHLMLRYRAVEAKQGKVGFVDKEIKKTDRNGKLGGAVAPVANWAASTGNNMTRPLMEKMVGIHKEAHLPKFHRKTFVAAAKSEVPSVNTEAPNYGRKAALFATCFVNYNNPDIGHAIRRVLAHNGVETEVVYPGCCGMPQLENGDIAAVAEKAKKAAQELKPWIDKGYEIIAQVPSCALMMKFEWPLIVPDDPNVKRLAEHTSDVTEYVVALHKDKGLVDGMQPLEGKVGLHLACHARAQNMGAKAAEMLRLIPDAELAVMERCSGHGGAWGVMKENFPVALKVGKPVARNMKKGGVAYVVSECPLAGDHILQGMDALDGEGQTPDQAWHPIELMAKSYGLD